jgi:hypothetical protein
VYLWKTYWELCSLGDWITFNVHVNQQGFPQVCWMEKVSDGVVPPGSNEHQAFYGGPQGMKRPQNDGDEMAKRQAMGGVAPTMAQWGATTPVVQQQQMMQQWGTM